MGKSAILVSIAVLFCLAISSKAHPRPRGSLGSQHDRPGPQPERDGNFTLEENRFDDGNYTIDDDEEHNFTRGGLHGRHGNRLHHDREGNSSSTEEDNDKKPERRRRPSGHRLRGGQSISEESNENDESRESEESDESREERPRFRGFHRRVPPRGHWNWSPRRRSGNSQ